jgi:hypothetical protein
VQEEPQERDEDLDMVDDEGEHYDCFCKSEISSPMHSTRP